MSGKREPLAIEPKKGTYFSKVSEDDVDDWEHKSTFTTRRSHSSGSTEEFRILGGSETSMVTKSRVIFLFVLILVAAGCATGTYLFARKQDKQNFETAVEEYANEIDTVSQLWADQVYGTLGGMARTVTAYAAGINATWPYIVINFFAERAEQLVNLSGANFVAFLPIVPKADVDKWTNFTLETNAGLPQGVNISSVITEGSRSFSLETNADPQGVNTSSVIKGSRNNTDNYLAPYWQSYPPIPILVNRDFYRPERNKMMLETRGVTLVDMFLGPDIDRRDNWPNLVISAPIFESFEDDAELVAYFSFVQPMDVLYKNILPEAARGMFVVVDPTDCPFVDTPITYKLDGSNCAYLGFGDKHDTTYEDFRYDFEFTVSASSCNFKVQIYPSKELEDLFESDRPFKYTIVVVALFTFTSVVFCIYDSFVEKRQTYVLNSAENNGAIVSSLFPERFRDQLLEDVAERKAGKKNRMYNSDNQDLGDGRTPIPPGIDDTFLQGNNLLTTKPLAELFPFVTVMFGDIAGFTAWSSIREPAQVFTLLEQIYTSFDSIAKQRKIFKVETIGDCYVAAAGLPEKRDDHAIVMARFASDCRSKMNKVVRQLEVLLGPDTAELQMRFGLHSGPVTAGVLRGEKCRFQLFGDTVNTCSRIESTGLKNMIHVSETTANLLIGAGLSDWVRPRDSLVSIKGKGNIQTYWLTTKRRGGDGRTQCTKITSDDDTSERGSVVSYEDLNSLKTERLIDWNVEVLLSQLKKIVAMRGLNSNIDTDAASRLRIRREEGRTVLDEVQEVIPLSTKKSSFQQKPEMVLLSKNVISQLNNFVTSISTMYRNNSFHNFEHASHVTMSVTKLLSRVVTDDTAIDKDFRNTQVQQQRPDISVQFKTEKLHDYTYGITSDPIINFACALSALIHDTDHTGVPNATLIKENAKIAEIYRNQSVAEQNSVDLAWKLLMEPRFGDLRACLFTTQEELDRFRQLVVNCVMATDIVDKELGALRKNRWKKAFSDAVADGSNREHVNRKATIVIEHIIQASDVSHTMQHWHVYLKWNERFFHECYQAYLDGRAEKDPSEGWYQGELGFFDFYIIPLAKKLKECQVFGVTSDEFLNYAMANRQEWESKGKEVVAGYMAGYPK